MKIDIDQYKFCTDFGKISLILYFNESKLGVLVKYVTLPVCERKIFQRLREITRVVSSTEQKYSCVAKLS